MNNTRQTETTTGVCVFYIKEPVREKETVIKIYCLDLRLILISWQLKDWQRELCSHNLTVLPGGMKAWISQWHLSSAGGLQARIDSSKVGNAVWKEGGNIVILMIYTWYLQRELFLFFYLEKPKFWNFSSDLKLKYWMI